MPLNKKLLKDFDLGLVIIVLLICAIGIITLVSATHAFNGGSKKTFIAQTIWVLAGLAMMIAAAFLDYNVYRAYYKVIYLINVGLLALVMVVGKVRNGAVSWFGIGSLGIQPSEFMKISLIIVFAKKIEEYEGNLNNFKNLAVLCAYAAVPLGLILAEPDLGTAMVFVVIIIGMLFMGGLNLRIFITSALAIAAVVLTLYYSPVQILKPHQRARIESFFNPSADPLNSDYQINQSKIAIGSGEFLGMGFENGLQNKGNYVPYSYTDFIFAVIGEEFGFVGSAVLILLYTMMTFRCLKVVHVAKDRFGSTVVVGVVCMLVFQMFQNIAMTIGLMPITGITLPFVSYGGSSMITSMVGIGLILNISMRRHKINF